MSENEVINNEDAKLYELGVNLISALDEKTQEEFENLKELIKKHSGTIVADSAPVSIPLAYTMTKNTDSKNVKHNNASFGWIKFSLTTDQVEPIKEELGLNANILRYIILRTEEESNTTSSAVAEALAKKVEGEDRPKRRKSKDAGEEDVVETEEVEADAEVEEDVEGVIDEAIDELVEEDK